MNPGEQTPEPFRQPDPEEHSVDVRSPSSSPEGWRPSDAPSSPERIGHPGSEENSPGRQEDHKTRL